MRKRSLADRGSGVLSFLDDQSFRYVLVGVGFNWARKNFWLTLRHVSRIFQLPEDSHPDKPAVFPGPEWSHGRGIVLLRANLGRDIWHHLLSD